MPTANQNASRIIAERKRRALYAQKVNREAAVAAGNTAVAVPTASVVIDEKLGAKQCVCAEGVNMRNNAAGCGCGAGN